jgi:protein-disulfide isomerase
MTLRPVLVLLLISLGQAMADGTPPTPPPTPKIAPIMIKERLSCNATTCGDKVSLPTKPIPAVLPSEHTLGKVGAGGVTVVVYFDFTCPHCAEEIGVLGGLLQTVTNVQIVARNFPLVTTANDLIQPGALMHKWGLLEAQAAEAAGAQGKYWEMFQLIFTAQMIGAFSQNATQPTIVRQLEGLAQVLNLDGTQFANDLTSNKYAQAILDQKAAGLAAGIGGTPAIFLNGDLAFSGGPTFDDLVSAVKSRMLALPAKPPGLPSAPILAPTNLPH